MTEAEARALATRMIDTWPNGPRAYVWKDAIKDHDYDIARHVYKLLRDTLTKASIADYVGAYRTEIRRREMDKPTPSTQPVQLTRLPLRPWRDLLAESRTGETVTGTR